MCDPLSVTASVIAIAGCAAQVCRCLSQSLSRYSEAPKGIQHYLAAVNALQVLFEGIEKLEKDTTLAALLTLKFSTRLQSCLLDLEMMETLATELQAQLDCQGFKRKWNLARLAFGPKRLVLENHLRRIKTYHRAFSLDLLLLNV